MYVCMCVCTCVHVSKFLCVSTPDLSLLTVKLRRIWCGYTVTSPSIPLSDLCFLLYDPLGSPFLKQVEKTE